MGIAKPSQVPAGGVYENEGIWRKEFWPGQGKRFIDVSIKKTHQSSILPGCRNYCPGSKTRPVFVKAQWPISSRILFVSVHHAWDRQP